MLLITIHEIIEEFGYNCKQISDMTGVSYNQVLDLKNFKIKYYKSTIKKINDWYLNRDKKVIEVKFEQQEIKKIHKLEQRGVTSLDEYRKSKIKEQRRIKREAREHERNEYLQNLFDK